jgi:hypothetical protein
VDLLGQIETLRSILYQCGQGTSLLNPQVLEISQLLDQLLNQYYGSIFVGWL